METKIRKAILKAMGKLTALALNEKAANGHEMEVALHVRFGSDIWVCIPAHNNACIDMIKAPATVDCIPDYEAKIERLMAELKVKLHQSSDILSTLNTEAND